MNECDSEHFALFSKGEQILEFDFNQHLQCGTQDIQMYFFWNKKAFIW